MTILLSRKNVIDAVQW